MSKHTPAPWKTGNCDDGIIWAPRFASTEIVSKGCTIGEPEAVVVAVVEYPAFAMGGLDPEERDAWLAETVANAKLIAAAPDMAEALADMLRIIEAVRLSASLGPKQMERVAKAKAVLAKAGEQ